MPELLLPRIDPPGLSAPSGREEIQKLRPPTPTGARTGSIPMTGLPPVAVLTTLEKMGLTPVSLAVNVTAIPPLILLHLKRHARNWKITSLPMTESPRFYKENTPVPNMVMSTPRMAAAMMPSS